MTDFLDRYTVQARLFPALITLLPGTVVVVSFPALVESWSTLWTVILSCGGVYLLAQIGRDRGKSLEPELFNEWGGKPTTIFLSYQGPYSDDRVRRLHRRIGELFTDLSLPNKTEEQQDFNLAEARYEEAVARLRSLTRDPEKFPLIVKENCSYGFRRNLWGLKPVGLFLSGVAAVLSGAMLTISSIQPSDANIHGLWGAGLASLLLLRLWAIKITPEWVRVPADEYAKRLLEATFRL